MLSQYFGLTLMYSNEMHQKNTELKQRAIDEYKAALLMPRKKKKKAKKSALSLYSIACWGEGFNFLN